MKSKIIATIALLSISLAGCSALESALPGILSTASTVTTVAGEVLSAACTSAPSVVADLNNALKGGANATLQKDVTVVNTVCASGPQDAATVAAALQAAENDVKGLTSN